MAAVELDFEREKETPGTIRFAEVVDDGDERVVGTLYVRKPAWERLGSPERLTVTVAVRSDG